MDIIVFLIVAICAVFVRVFACNVFERVGSTVVLVLLLIVGAGTAFAEQWGGVPFPSWPRITVAQILKPAPEISSTAGYGSVTKEYRALREVVGCPIEVDGRVVGWSMACKGEGK